MLSLILVIFVTIVTMASMRYVPIKILRILAAFGSCISLSKMLDWFRLFDETAFYVLLVSETLRDITWFMLLLIVALMMFGLPMVMLNQNSEDEDQVLIEDKIGSWVLDAILN
mmetsp:Transcript_44003/g.58383  ORF Transcript_44003/g.58383 Transcript_44003/m.58383 type:complete len:113 (+) Transcript_44003:1627-1965(+)